MVASEQLAQVFVDVADTLVDDFDLMEFLQKVATHASELIDARDAGLLLADEHGQLQLMAATDQRAETVELFQIQAHQGPCHDCYKQGAAVVNADLAQASPRWPSFAPKAVSAGYRAVHAFPLRLRGEVFGALNLFGTAPAQLTTSDASIIQAMADIATIGLVAERAIEKGEVAAKQLQSALDSRVMIEQAKGALAQIHRESPDEAFNRLRSYCRARHLRLSEVARDITTNSGRFTDLTNPQ